MPSQEKSPRLLIVRRDNIGDLVCTTPLIRALRERYPDGWIGVLANSYNAPVLDGNPDVNEVFVYTKVKHRRPNESVSSILLGRLSLILRLRAMQLDEVILATPAPQPRGIVLARWIKPRRTIGFGNLRGLDVALPMASEPTSEVEDVFRVARLHGVVGEPPACNISAERTRAPVLTVAVHISARKLSQRWPVEHFAALMRILKTKEVVRFVLLWSPGASDDPRHPGDDDKMAALLNALGPAFPVDAVRTGTLAELVDALARCHAMICADGGAMHVAAGLGLPIVCLFGDSGATRWHPWGVPYRLIQEPSRHVADISAEQVASAFSELRGGIPAPSA